MVLPSTDTNGNRNLYGYWKLTVAPHAVGPVTVVPPPPPRRLRLVVALISTLVQTVTLFWALQVGAPPPQEVSAAVPGKVWIWPGSMLDACRTAATRLATSVVVDGVLPKLALLDWAAR